jgi:hypothetical protein
MDEVLEAVGVTVGEVGVTVTAAPVRRGRTYSSDGYLKLDLSDRFVCSTPSIAALLVHVLIYRAHQDSRAAGQGRQDPKLSAEILESHHRGSTPFSSLLSLYSSCPSPHFYFSLLLLSLFSLHRINFSFLPMSSSSFFAYFPPFALPLPFPILSYPQDGRIFLGRFNSFDCEGNIILADTYQLQVRSLPALPSVCLHRNKATLTHSSSRRLTRLHKLPNIINGPRTPRRAAVHAMQLITCEHAQATWSSARSRQVHHSRRDQTSVPSFVKVDDRVKLSW